MKFTSPKFSNSFCALAVVCLLCVCAPPPTNALIEDVLDILHVVKEVTSGILKAWEVVQSTPLAQNIEFPLMREKQRKVLLRLKEVSRQISETEEKYAHNVAVAVQSINSHTLKNTRLITKMNDISDIMNRITTRFQQMQKYEAHKDKLEISTLVRFAEWTVSPNGEAVDHMMERMHLILLGQEEKQNVTTSMLDMMAENYESSSEEICHTKQSPQQFVYSLYADIALTELKGYTMMEFSWMMLRIYGKGNFSQEAELMRTDFEKRTERTLKSLKDTMKRSDRIVWSCDPDMLVKGKTYDEVTRLLQGYIENEVDLNNDETCRETCPYYQNTKTEGCFKDKFCSRQPRCSGRLYHCQFVDSDMWVCPASNNSTRRYEYVEYENGVVLGQKTNCVRGTTKVDSWWRYLFWHCSYCFCLCDDSNLKSDRYFNLRETLSDMQHNKVVTGLRLIKNNKIFHLQIQHGELLPRGSINISSITWKPIEQYTIFDRSVKRGIDFHTLSYESRSIDLDDIHTDDNSFVVTGVRWRVIGAHLNLEAHFSEFDFEMGKLIAPEAGSFWKSNDNTDVSGERRVKITLSSPDMSSRTRLKSVRDSKHNQYIDFVNSDMRKDAAQSTVPFIDIQPVVSNPPVPLAGVGIYHKGQPGFGGFLGPKIMTYDFQPHIKLPPKTIK